MRLLIPLLTVAVCLAACDKSEPPSKARPDIPPPPPEQVDPVAAAEARQKALENAPEPELDPDSPREQFELVFHRAKGAIRSFQGERHDILQQLRAIKLDGANAAHGATRDQLVKTLDSWALSKKKKRLEVAAKTLCETIEAVRGPAQALIEAGQSELGAVNAQLEEIDAQLEAGETVRQRVIDKVEEAKKQHSQPVSAGKFVFLAIKSMLDEAYVLADHGPRRAQLELKACLGKIAETPLPLEQAQTQLTKVLDRTKYYRR